MHSIFKMSNSKVYNLALKISSTFSLLFNHVSSEKHVLKSIACKYIINCKHCEKNGGELVEIWSEKKQQKVNQLFMNLSKIIQDSKTH
jgi:hypothetical protein